jgi:hypothetical protein
MSKASEYAKAISGAGVKQPEDFIIEADSGRYTLIRAEVTEHGMLNINEFFDAIDAGQAIRFAEWIMQNFSD